MATDAIPTGPITLSPAPWHTKATMYLIPFWTSAATAKNLPDKAYHPLELQSSFASREFGTPKGGLSMIQLIRYHETPVGPYDEMILAPGSFEYPFQDKSGKKTTRTAPRVTRIYVSQKYTLWNLPKHLARFEWATDPSTKTTTIKVFPHDSRPAPGQPYDPTESRPSATPFFQCTIRAIPYLPYLPISSSWLGKVVEVAMVQPPLPEGSAASQGELPGTEEWVRLKDYRQWSDRGCLGWIDVKQTDGDGGEEEFWPGLGKGRRLVVILEKGVAEIGEGERWATPGYLL